MWSIEIVFNDFEVEKHFCVRQTARNDQIDVPDRNCILATSKSCPIQRMLSKNHVPCYLWESGKITKPKRMVVEIVLSDQGAKTVLETVLRSPIETIVSEEIVFKNATPGAEDQVHEPWFCEDVETKIKFFTSENYFIKARC